MKSDDILQQFFNDTNSRIRNVHFPANKFCAVGLGEMPVKPSKNKTEDLEIIHIYEHMYVRTKIYYDEGCAAYKLIRHLEKLIGDKTSVIFWRLKPRVEHTKDFLTLQNKFIGMARVSVF